MKHDNYIECPACAEWIRAKAKICRYCGAILDDGDLPDFAPQMKEADDFLASVEEKFNRSGLDVSDSHRRRIVEFLKSSEDQYRTGTVLFVDIVGYTKLCEELSAEDVRNLISAFSSIFIQTVEFYNGFVVEFAGDGALAVFGAPLGFERDAEAAVRAALEVRRVMDSISIRRRKIKLSSGLATGRVLSTIIRTSTPPHHKIYGQAINLAARIRASAGPGEILIDSRTHELAASAIQSESLGKKRYKNVEEPEEVFAVKGTIAPGARQHGLSAPYIGRQDESNRIELAWRNSIARAASSFPAHLVTGEPGIGKSRFADEFASRVGGQARIIRTSASSFDAKLPWNLWATVVRQLWGGHSGETTGETQAGLTALAGSLGLSSNVVHSIATLLNLRGEERIKPQDPLLFQKLIAADLSSLLRAAAVERPILVLLDDLQWADESSVVVLERVVFDLPPANVFFLLLHRSDFRLSDSWNNVPCIGLQPLSLDERRHLFNLLLDARCLLPEIREELTNRLDGTPFYLVEVVRALRNRISEMPAKQLSLPGDLKSWVPQSLREMLQARLDTLDQNRKNVIRCASVIGSCFTLEALDLYEHIRENLLTKLYNLKSLDYIDDMPLPKGLEFVFRHEMLREVAYQSLLESQRRDLHRIIAEHIETKHRDKSADYYHLLAHHYDLAGEDEKAIAYLVKAGQEDILLAALPEARMNLEKALRKIDAAHSDDKHSRAKAGILRQLGIISRYNGEPARAREVFEQARLIAQQHRMELELAEIDADLGLLCAETGEFTKAKRFLARAERRARALKKRKLLAVIYNYKGVCAWNQSDWKTARTAYQRSSRSLTATENPVLMSDIKNNLALLEWKAGRVSMAKPLLAEAIRLRKKTGNRFGLAISIMNMGIMHEQMGKWKEAEKSYREAIEIATAIRFAQVLSGAHANLANLYLAMDESDLAFQQSSHSLQLAESSGDKRLTAIAYENLALASLGLQLWSEARRWRTNGQELARELKDGERLFSLDLVHLEELIATSDSRESKTLLLRLEKQVHRNGYTFEYPRILRLKALDLQRRGKREDASRILTEAVAQARKLQNASEEFRLRRLIKGLKNVDKPDNHT